MARTFAYFAGRVRPPTEYEELSVGLSWLDSATKTDIGNFRLDSTALARVEWEDFRDPSALHYRTYVAQQERAEQELDGVFDTAREAGYPAGFAAEWVRALSVFVGAFSFFEWGVGMAQQQVQRFCIGSTLAQSAQLQAMDALRHAERDLQWWEIVSGTTGDDYARATWTDAEELQPLRRYVEEVLVAGDWGEVAVATNLVLENLVQRFVRGILAEGGKRHGDLATIALSRATWTDVRRHVLWARAMVNLAVSAHEDNESLVRKWISRYTEPAHAAVAELARAHPLDGIARGVAKTAWKEYRADLGALGPEDYCSRRENLS